MLFFEHSVPSYEDIDKHKNLIFSIPIKYGLSRDAHRAGGFSGFTFMIVFIAPSCFPTQGTQAIVLPAL